MADYVIDHMSTTAVRGAFLLKVVLNLLYGTLSFFITDVQPRWVIGGMFLTAGILNLYPLITLRPTKLISAALALSVGGCAIRAGAVIWAYAHGTLHSTFPKIFMGVSLWVGLALFGIATTLGATDQLGRGSGARGSGHHRRG